MTQSETEVPEFAVELRDEDARKDYAGMYADLVEEFGEETVEDIVEERLGVQAAQMVELMYDNQAQLEAELGE